jgi:hypothetical protein
MCASLAELKELHMSFESVWGFDPNKATQQNDLSQSEPETDYSPADERAARIPGDVDSQVYELRRMYRL